MYLLCGTDSDETQLPNRCNEIEAGATVADKVALALSLMVAEGKSLGSGGRTSLKGDTGVFAYNAGRYGRGTIGETTVFGAAKHPW